MTKRADVLGAAAFALAVIVVLMVVLALTGCVQPYPAESKTMGTMPICLFACIVTQTSIEDNTTDSLTPTVGTAVTGGSDSRSTVIEKPAQTSQY